VKADKGSVQKRLKSQPMRRARIEAANLLALVNRVSHFLL
jgi:hypothetical protein